MAKSYAAGSELIVVMIAGQQFAIDIMSVREIRGWTASTPLPHAPPYVLGMINLRGQILPVIDFAARLGLGESQPNSASVVIVTDINGVLAGFLVEAVCDILTMDDGMLQPPPELGDSDAPRFVQGVITSAEAIITLLSIEEVLPEPSALAA